MAITRIITDIPPERVNFVTALVRADGGTFEREVEASGRVTVIATFAALPEPALDEAPAGTVEFKWMQFARAEMGQAEGGPGSSNPRIEAYHASTHGGAAPDSVPWCSSFVNFCVVRAGFTGTNSKMARSWLNWGGESQDLVPGCIVVMKRGDPPKGHVGFYVGQEGGRIRLLGGNQGNKVGIASFEGSAVIGLRVMTH